MADIIGAAAQVLRAAGYNIVGSDRRQDQRDFGYGAIAGRDIDLVGDDDDDDDDDDDIEEHVAGAIRNISMGRALTRKQKKALRKAAKAAKKKERREADNELANALAMAGKPGVRQDDSFTMRALNLNLGSVVVLAGNVNFLTARAQEPLRIERIMLDPNGAAFGNLFVTSIFVGVRVQAANLGEMPLIAFAFNATGAYLQGNTVDKGVDFVTNLRNGTVANVTVSGTVFGKALQT